MHGLAVGSSQNCFSIIRSQFTQILGKRITTEKKTPKSGSGLPTREAQQSVLAVAKNTVLVALKIHLKGC